MANIASALLCNYTTLHKAKLILKKMKLVNEENKKEKILTRPIDSSNLWKGPY